MLKDYRPNKEVVAEIAKHVVSQFAPEELDMFDELLEGYFADPQPPEANKASGDDPLAFGFADVVLATTPAVAAMVTVSLDVWGKIGAKKLEATASNPGVHSLTAAPVRAEDSLTTLSIQELRKVRQAAIVMGNQFGIDRERAEEMANAMLALLILGVETQIPARHPIKVLFLACSPEDLEPLGIDSEINAIDTALRESQAEERLQIVQHWAVRVGDLATLALRHRPNIVHISGHGDISGTLALLDEYGKVSEVPVAALGELFGVLKDDLCCVVLNSCYSAAQADAIATYVDAVITMSGALRDKAAVYFSAAFYQALAYGKDVPTAFRLGVTQLQLRGMNDDADMPCLSLRSERSESLTLVP